MQSAPESPEVITPRCPHFGECGGCAFQDVPYPTQVERKAEALSQYFAGAWGRPIEVAASPAIWHYRNKVDPNFGPKYYDEPPPKDFVRDTVLGFKRKGRWFQPLDIEDCHIAPENLGTLLDSVRKWIRESGHRGYDSRTDEGLLKTLLVREGKRTGQRMVVLLTGEGEVDTAGFLGAVQGSWPATSVQHGLSLSKAGAVEAEHFRTLAGTETIEEELHLPNEGEERRLRFRLSPLSFFQTNTFGTEILYGLIREWIRHLTPDTLYDLYGGSGGIALSCADLAGHIESVENVPEASVDGRFNAETNGIGNVRFTTAKVKNYLREVIREQEQFAPGSVAIVDPPRSCMTPKALRRLIELRPDAVVYVSCNPRIMARDELPVFLEHYNVMDVKAVDLFPHTPHVEALVRMERK